MVEMGDFGVKTADLGRPLPLPLPLPSGAGEGGAFLANGLLRTDMLDAFRSRIRLR